LIKFMQELASQCSSSVKQEEADVFADANVDGHLDEEQGQDGEGAEANAEGETPPDEAVAAEGADGDAAADGDEVQAEGEERSAPAVESTAPIRLLCLCFPSLLVAAAQQLP